MRIECALEELGKAVHRAQEDAHALGEIRATLLVNFGPTSLSLKRYGFQVDTEGTDNKDSTLNILVFVMEKLIARGGKPTC